MKQHYIVIISYIIIFLTCILPQPISKKPLIMPTTRPSKEPTPKPSFEPTFDPTIEPTTEPTSQPTCEPTAEPTAEPTFEPTSEPTAEPTFAPTDEPTFDPTRRPTRIPSKDPTLFPTRRPTTIRPTRIPTATPTAEPSDSPTSSLPTTVPTTTIPTSNPTKRPFANPTFRPSRPSTSPTRRPTKRPRARPTVIPSNDPTRRPTSPTVHPTSLPSSPTFDPTIRPTSPTNIPSIQPSTPTIVPTIIPTKIPSLRPSFNPTNPTFSPTAIPTTPSLTPSAEPSIPTSEPTQLPSIPTFTPTTNPTVPTITPTEVPSVTPTSMPTLLPTTPTVAPTLIPTNPTEVPTSLPSLNPTDHPTSLPSAPTLQPSMAPSKPTLMPTITPSTTPTNEPTTPTGMPTGMPSNEPTRPPTEEPSTPTVTPSTEPSQPTVLPSSTPSRPTTIPTSEPTYHPSEEPSSEPTASPSIAPTNFPTDNPTSQPSVKPSSPTLYPTVQPSSPTAIPSVQPTSPTMSPTFTPTTSPTITPSLRPSYHPSKQPSYKPTISPTTNPSSKPSQLPSVMPSSPSFQPSTQPSSPTTQPTMVPSSPTISPTISPTTLPTSHPTLTPSHRPTTSPTTIPSLNPTLIPTDNPSFQPTERPSSPTAQPTVQPSRPTELPTVQPTSPTMIPSLSPSERPSSHPTVSPISSPLFHPPNSTTSLPTTEPTSLAFIPTTQPTIQPFHVTTTTPNGLTINPSSIPTTTILDNPTITVSPTLFPISGPSFPSQTTDSTKPTIYPSSTPPTSSPSEPVYSTITNIDISISTLKVFINSSQNGVVYCAGFPSELDALTSIDVIFLQNFMNITSNFATSVLLTKMSPATDYRIYCSLVTLSGSKNSLSQAIESSINVTTSCCKQLVVEILTPLLLLNSSEVKAIQLTLSHAPSNLLNVEVFTAVDNVIAYYPSLLTWNHTVISKSTSYLYSDQNVVYTKNIGATAINIGNNSSFQLLLSGPSAAEYNISYLTPNLFQVIVESESLLSSSIPKLLGAIFSTDGRSINIQFSQATDCGGYYTSFDCNNILIFNGSGTSSCLWLTPSLLSIFPIGLWQVTIGDTIRIRDGLIRSKCFGLTTCWDFPTMTSFAVILSPPLYLNQPVVVTSCPSQVSAGEEVILDVSSSVGAAHKEWTSITLSVHSASCSTSSLQSILNAVNASQVARGPLVIISSNELEAYCSYAFTIKLCNFLGSCGFNTHTIQVMEEDMPTLRLLGPSLRVVQRNQILALKYVIASNRYTSNLISVADMSNYLKLMNISLCRWMVYVEADDGTHTEATSLNSLANNGTQTTFSSLSTDVFTFKILSSVFDVGVKYTISLTVRLESGTEMVTFSKVYVARTSPVASITGGSDISVTIGESVSLNASNSYDIDYGNTELEYYWSCYQIWPIVVNNVKDNVINITTNISFIITELSHVHLLINFSDSILVGSQYLITLKVVSKVDNIEAYSSVKITLVDRPTSFSVSMPMLMSIQTNTEWKINTEEKLKVVNIVTTTTGDSRNCTWTSSPEYVLFDSNALTPIHYFVPANSILFTNLVLPGQSLRSNSVYSFTLNCYNVDSSNSDSSLVKVNNWVTVTVIVNKAPLAGLFNINPNHGIPFISNMTFTAEYWTSDNLPLSYEFGLIAGDSDGDASEDLFLLLKTKSEQCHFVSTLPYIYLDGNSTTADGNTISCWVRVSDAYDTEALAYNDVVLYQSTESITSNNITSDNDTDWLLAIRSLESRTTYDSLWDKSTLHITILSTMLNAVNCTLSINCSELGRLPCSKLSHHCSECMEGYYGEKGPANSRCYQQQYFNSGNDNDGDTTINFCDNTDDCIGSKWKQCVDGKCSSISKACPDQCNEHGTCTFTSSYLNIVVDDCYVGDTTCIAICDCDTNYYGDSCNYFIDEMETRRERRLYLLQLLWDLILSQNIEGVTCSDLLLYSYALNSLTIQQSDLSDSAMLIVEETLAVLLAKFRVLTCSNEATVKLLYVVDAYATAHTASLTSVSSGNTSLLMRYLGDIISYDMTVGEYPILFVGNSLRSSMAYFQNTENDGSSSSLTLIIPLTKLESKLEKFYDGNSNTIFLIDNNTTTSSTYRLSSVVMRIGAFDESKLLTSSQIPMFPPVACNAYFNDKEIASVTNISVLITYNSLFLSNSSSYSFTKLEDTTTIDCNSLGMTSGQLDSTSKCELHSMTSSEIVCYCSLSLTAFLFPITDTTSSSTSNRKLSLSTISEVNSDSIIKGVQSFLLSTSSSETSTIQKSASSVLGFTLTLQSWRVLSVVSFGLLVTLSVLLGRRFVLRSLKVDIDDEIIDIDLVRGISDGDGGGATTGSRRRKSSRGHRSKRKSRRRSSASSTGRSILVPSIQWPLPSLYDDMTYWYRLSYEFRVHYGWMGFGGRRMSTSIICVIAQAFDGLIALSLVAALFDLFNDGSGSCVLPLGYATSSSGISTSSSFTINFNQISCFWGAVGCGSSYENVSYSDSCNNYRTYVIIAVLVSFLIIPFRILLICMERILLSPLKLPKLLLPPLLLSPLLVNLSIQKKDENLSDNILQQYHSIESARNVSDGNDNISEVEQVVGAVRRQTIDVQSDSRIGLTDDTISPNITEKVDITNIVVSSTAATTTNATAAVEELRSQEVVLIPSTVTPKKKEKEKKKEKSVEVETFWFNLPSPTRSPVKIDIDRTDNQHPHGIQQPDLSTNSIGMIQNEPCHKSVNSVAVDTTASRISQNIDMKIFEKEFHSCCHLPLKSKKQKILLLFQSELLRCKQSWVDSSIFIRKCASDFPQLFYHPSNFLSRVIATLTIIMIGIIIFSYLSAFTQRSSDSLQQAWMYSVFIWIAVDGCAIKTILVLFREFLVPNLIYVDIRELVDEMARVTASITSNTTCKGNIRRNSKVNSDKNDDVRQATKANNPSHGLSHDLSLHHIANSQDLLSINLAKRFPELQLTNSLLSISQTIRKTSEAFNDRQIVSANRRSFYSNVNYCIKFVFACIVLCPVWMETTFLHILSWGLISSVILIAATFIEKDLILLLITLLLSLVSLLLRALLELIAIWSSQHEKIRNNSLPAAPATAAPPNSNTNNRRRSNDHNLNDSYILPNYQLKQQPEPEPELEKDELKRKASVTNCDEKQDNSNLALLSINKLLSNYNQQKTFSGRSSASYSKSEVEEGGVEVGGEYDSNSNGSEGDDWYLSENSSDNESLPLKSYVIPVVPLLTIPTTTAPSDHCYIDKRNSNYLTEVDDDNDDDDQVKENDINENYSNSISRSSNNSISKKLFADSVNRVLLTEANDNDLIPLDTVENNNITHINDNTTNSRRRIENDNNNYNYQHDENKVSSCYDNNNDNENNIIENMPYFDDDNDEASFSSGGHSFIQDELMDIIGSLSSSEISDDSFDHESEFIAHIVNKK